MKYSKLGHTFFFNNTDALVVKIINKYQNATGVFFKIDKNVINYFKSCIRYASYEKRETNSGVAYHHIETKYGIVSAPMDDKSVIIILN